MSVLLESTVGTSITYHSTNPIPTNLLPDANHQQIWLIALPMALPLPI
jgi:hypothetical protein